MNCLTRPALNTRASWRGLYHGGMRTHDSSDICTPSDIRLMQASKQGDEAGVQHALADGARTTVFDRHGFNALMRCCEGTPTPWRVRIIERLLAAGAGPNVTREKEGTVALHLLCFGLSIGGEDPQTSEARKASVQRLIEASAVVDMARTDGHTALMSAAGGGHLPVMQALLDGGARADFRRRDGSTAMMYAAACGRTEAVRLLLDHGANPNARESDGWTPCLFAAKHNHPEILRLLHQRGGEVGLTTRAGENALWLTSSVACVRFLYAQGLRAPPGQAARGAFRAWHLSRHGAGGAECLALCEALDRALDQHAGVERGLRAGRGGQRRLA